ncbi:MAG: hypothetical protein WDW38_011425 [Sanguina aurantia]
MDDSPSRKICKVCVRQYSSYTCPRCNTAYCSVACYKLHSTTCTEHFYRTQAEQELKQNKAEEGSKGKMKEILARFHALDHEDPTNQYLNPEGSDSDHCDGQDDIQHTRSTGAPRQQQQRLDQRLDQQQQQLQLSGGRGLYGAGAAGVAGEGDSGSGSESGGGSDGEEGDGGGAPARAVGADPVADALSQETLRRLFVKAEAAAASGVELQVTDADLDPSEWAAFARAIDGRPALTRRPAAPWVPWWFSPEARELSLNAAGQRVVTDRNKHGADSESSSSSSSSGGEGDGSDREEADGSAVSRQHQAGRGGRRERRRRGGRSGQVSSGGGSLPAGASAPLPRLTSLTTAAPSPLLRWQLLDLLYSYCLVTKRLSGAELRQAPAAATMVMAVAEVLTSTPASAPPSRVFPSTAAAAAAAAAKAPAASAVGSRTLTPVHTISKGSTAGGSGCSQPGSSGSAPSQGTAPDAAASVALSPAAAPSRVRQIPRPAAATAAVVLPSQSASESVLGCIVRACTAAAGGAGSGSAPEAVAAVYDVSMLLDNGRASVLLALLQLHRLLEAAGLQLAEKLKGCRAVAALGGQEGTATAPPTVQHTARGGEQGSSGGGGGTAQLSRSAAAQALRVRQAREVEDAQQRLQNITLDSASCQGSVPEPRTAELQAAAGLSGAMPTAAATDPASVAARLPASDQRALVPASRAVPSDSGSQKTALGSKPAAAAIKAARQELVQAQAAARKVWFMAVWANESGEDVFEQLAAACVREWTAHTAMLEESKAVRRARGTASLLPSNGNPASAGSLSLGEIGNLGSRLQTSPVIGGGLVGEVGAGGGTLSRQPAAGSKVVIEELE